MQYSTSHEDLPVEAIRWIEAAGECVCIHALTGSRIVRQTLDEVEEQLDPGLFARVHESAIVRLAKVQRIRRLSSGNGILEMEGGAEVRVHPHKLGSRASWEISRR